MAIGVCIDTLVLRDLQQNRGICRDRSRDKGNNGDVDNEGLVREKENCQVLLRVAVMLNATPFPNSLLQDVSITLFTKDVDDIVSEVNVFIYYLDQSFLDAYLASSLQLKVEKSFVDVWLT